MEPMYVSSHAPHGKAAALNTEPPFLLFCSVPKRLLAEPLLAICATERGARRTDKVVACRIGLPVAAAIAVAVIVVVAIIIAVVATIEGTEWSRRDRACRCDGTADDGREWLIGSGALEDQQPITIERPLQVAANGH